MKSAPAMRARLRMMTPVAAKERGGRAGRARRAATFPRKRRGCAGSVIRQVVARKQGVGEAELGKVPDSHRIEDTVEVVHLVLHDARMEIAHGSIDRAPCGVHACIAQVPMPGYQPAQ